MKDHYSSILKYCVVFSIVIIIIGILVIVGGGEIEAINFSVKVPTSDIKIGDHTIPNILIGVGIAFSGLGFGRWCKCEFVLPFISKP